MAYATPEELASYLQQDLDRASAELAISLAEGYLLPIVGLLTETTGVVQLHVTDPCDTQLDMPRWPVTAVTAVTVDGSAVVDYTVTPTALHRPGGWATGQDYTGQPVQVTVAGTWGYSTVPADVKAATLFLAGSFFTNPAGAGSVRIDDFAQSELNLSLPPVMEANLRAAYGSGAYVTGTRP